MSVALHIWKDGWALWSVGVNPLKGLFTGPQSIHRDNYLLSRLLSKSDKSQFGWREPQIELTLLSPGGRWCPPWSPTIFAIHLDIYQIRWTVWKFRKTPSEMDEACDGFCHGNLVSGGCWSDYELFSLHFFLNHFVQKVFCSLSQLPSFTISWIEKPPYLATDETSWSVTGWLGWGALIPLHPRCV